MSEYTYFLCVDKDVDLTDFIEVYNVAMYYEDEVGYSELMYKTEVDKEFFKHIHIITTGHNLGLDDFEVFAIDNNFHYYPLQDEDDFDKYIMNMGYIFPDDNTLCDTFYDKSDAKAAIEDYITEIAELKAQKYIDDPWSKYDC